MSATSVAAFDQTLQKANVWLRDIRTELWWLDSDRVYHALRAVLHALRDRLTLEEAVNLGAQLPLILRGCYYEGWRPRHAPSSERTKAQFGNDWNRQDDLVEVRNRIADGLLSLDDTNRRVRVESDAIAIHRDRLARIRH